MTKKEKEQTEMFPVVRNVWQRKRVRTPVGTESMTKQSFKDECDINNIMARYRKTGMLPVNTGKPMFGDFTQANDFTRVKMQLAHAEEDFENLPSDIRSRFENDPAKLLKFLENEENREEAIELGLIPVSEPEELIIRAPDLESSETGKEPENGSKQPETKGKEET